MLAVYGIYLTRELLAQVFSVYLKTEGDKQLEAWNPYLTNIRIKDHLKGADAAFAEQLCKIIGISDYVIAHEIFKQVVHDNLWAPLEPNKKLHEYRDGWLYGVAAYPIGHVIIDIDALTTSAEHDFVGLVLSQKPLLYLLP